VSLSVLTACFCTTCLSADMEANEMRHDEIVSVRYMVDDVDEAVAFYTKCLDFEVLTNFPPAFADVKRGNLRLLLAGPTSSAGRPMPDGAKPGPGGWNRIHFIVDDLSEEVDRLRAAGARFRNDIIEGPGGKQILLLDPSDNVVELFQPADRNPT
jgi:catechol 2,3-dioxygenase-like lactoylglutathione lyase family enzyme